MSTRAADVPWLPSAQQPAAAVFGKVAARGDFWSSGEQGPAEREFAGWLTRSVEASGGRIPRGAVRFVASAADGPTLVGSWIASRDAVGRAFPLSVWCRVPAEVEGAHQTLLLLHHETFAVAAERAFSACLESELDELERAREGLVTPHTSALPGLLQQVRGALAGVHVHTFARRNFERWPVASLGYAVAALQRAGALVEPELTLDVPVSSPCDLFAWLELLLGALGGAQRPSRILWSPSLGRMLVCLGRPSTQLLAYLDGAEQGSSRRWPLWTETRQAALVARAELDADSARCLDDNGTLSQLIALLRGQVVSSVALASLAGCLEPVSAALPAGVDARLEPEHELLRREIAKLSAVESAAPDWPLVSSVGRELLTAKSKDLLVAVYVACSLAVQQPVLGAAHGTALLVSLISRFGALLFPVRSRARVGALAWYLEWLSAELDLPHPSSQPEVASLREQLHQLREAATVLLGDAAPSFSAVLRSCERLERMRAVADTADGRARLASETPRLRATEAVEPAAVERATVDRAPVERAAVERAPVEPAAVERAPVESAPVGRSAVERAAVEPGRGAAPPSRGAVLARVSATQPALERAPATHSDRPPPASVAHSGSDAGAADPESARHVFGAPPEAPRELQAYVARAGTLLVELARSRFALDRTDARSYRWLRTGLWLRWERAPEPNRRGRTDLDGPSPTRQVELSRAVKAEQWDDVLALSEQLLVKSPLWLDANRCSLLALDKLGDAYATARDHVARDTQALLARLPQLATLVFSDGTPLASPDTLRWLLPATTSLAVVAPEGGLPEPLRERLLRRERAARRAASVEVDELLRASGSARSSFLLRLEVAALLEHAGQSREAILVYRGLERDLDTFQLERWEPALALRVLSPLWKLSSTQDGGSHAEAERTGARLAQLSTTLLL